MTTIDDTRVTLAYEATTHEMDRHGIPRPRYIYRSTDGVWRARNVPGACEGDWQLAWQPPGVTVPGWLDWRHVAITRRQAEEWINSGWALERIAERYIAGLCHLFGSA